MASIGQAPEVPKTNEGLVERRLVIAHVNWEVVVLVTIVALAAVLRFWDLGSRILHHDESIHAVYSWYLLTGRGYVHNPIYHGPFIYHATALMYFLFGAADYTARMAPALFGTLMVGLPFLLRRQLGRTGALVAAFLLAISPSILYYSRSLRHDIFAATATLVLIVALWRYVEDRQPRWLYLAACGLVLGFANHELTFMTVFMLMLFLLPAAAPSILKTFKSRDQSKLSPWAEFLLFVGTLAAPQFTAAILLIQRFLRPGAVEPPVGEPNLLLLITFVALFWSAAALGLWWRRRTWVFGALIFYIAFALLYTAFLSNPNGFFSGAIGALQYWLSQQAVKRGAQPWFYYLILLPLYEFLPMLFGLAGVVYAVVRRHFFSLFLAYWAFLGFALYSWAGEKMPWLVIHITIPFVLLAGLAIGKLIEAVDWRTLWRRGGGILFLWYALAITVLIALWNRGTPFALGRSAIEAQQALIQSLFLIALFAGIVVLAWRKARDITHGGTHALACVFLAGLLCLTVRAAWQVNYYNGDTPIEMLVYTQSSPDVGKVMKEIERVGFRTGAGMDLKVAYDDEVSWPFEWYLRDYKSRSYYGNGTPPADAPIVIVGIDNDHDARVRPVLGNQYVGQRYKLRWWFPEDYRNITPSSILSFLFDPATRGQIWRYFMYRETVNPLGSTDFMLYERKDLVSGTFNVTATTGPAAPAEQDDYQKLARSVTASQAFGTAGKGEGQFSEPKNLALGPDGSIYVVDSKNNRVEKFNSSGHFVLQWGTAGQGDGQFSEPWGIAVAPDGTVYVADTWNHRVERFDQNGRFLGKWGQYGNTADGSAATGTFFGPRGITLDAQGNIFITDTGNHRIQEFDKEGRPLASVGVRGGGNGQFNEPVGIAVDGSGAIYVADTWNRRIQKFDANLRPTTQWPIDGWLSQSPNNKPFLAVDSTGNVFATDPENNRVVKFTPDGKASAVWGQFGSDLAALRMPTGIAVGANGSLLVADSLNNRIVKYETVP